MPPCLAECCTPSQQNAPSFVYVYVWVGACDSQTSMSGSQYLSTLFFRQSWLLHLKLTDSARWTSKPQGSSHLYLPHSGIIDTCHHTTRFMWGMEIQTWVFMLVWQVGMLVTAEVFARIDRSVLLVKTKPMISYSGIKLGKRTAKSLAI